MNFRYTFKIIGLIIIILIGLFIIFTDNFCSQSDCLTEDEIIPYPSDSYYDDLQDICDSKDSSEQGCCESSLKTMEENRFYLAENGSCDYDGQLNMLKCVGSLRWCEYERRN